MRNRKVISLILVASAMTLVSGVGCWRRVVFCASMFGTQSAKVGAFGFGEETGRQNVRSGRDLEGHGTLSVHMLESGFLGIDVRRKQQQPLLRVQG